MMVRNDDVMNSMEGREGRGVESRPLSPAGGARLGEYGSGAGGLVTGMELTDFDVVKVEDDSMDVCMDFVSRLETMRKPIKIVLLKMKSLLRIASTTVVQVRFLPFGCTCIQLCG